MFINKSKVMPKIKKKAKLDHTMPFGKYSGVSFKEIIEKDLSYYKWLLKEDIIEPKWELFSYAYKYFNVEKTEKQIKLELKIMKQAETQNKKVQRIMKDEKEREDRAARYQVYLDRMNSDIDADKGYTALK